MCVGSIVPWCDCCLKVSDDHMEVWCISSVAHVPCGHQSQDKAIVIKWLLLSFRNFILMGNCVKQPSCCIVISVTSEDSVFKLCLILDWACSCMHMFIPSKPCGQRTLYCVITLCILQIVCVLCWFLIRYSLYTKSFN